MEKVLAAFSAWAAETCFGFLFTLAKSANKEWKVDGYQGVIAA